MKRQQAKSTAFKDQAPCRLPSHHPHPPLACWKSAPELSFQEHEDEAATQRKLTLEKDRPTTTSEVHKNMRSKSGVSQCFRHDCRWWWEMKPCSLFLLFCKVCKFSLMTPSSTASKCEYFHQHKKRSQIKNMYLTLHSSEILGYQDPQR